MPVLCLIARPVPYLETIKYFTVKSIFRCLIERPPLAGCCRRTRGEIRYLRKITVWPNKQVENRV